MTTLPYYPGCTLSTKAHGYDRSARVVMAALGFALEELPDWQCCGATFPLTLDDSMALIAPTRVLHQAQQAGERVAVACAICFHVLRRSQALLDRDPAMLERINWFTEQEYAGVRVMHLLEILRDEVGWERVSERARERESEKTTPYSLLPDFHSLRIAPYYGCLLLRPYTEIGLDDPERPAILHDLVRALGAEAVDFPYNIECCGSYLVVKEPRVPQVLAQDIIASARECGAQAIVTACPLCQFNLDYPQRETGAGRSGNEIPVLYFTQLMAAALGLPEEDCGLEGHYVDPLPLLKGRGR